MKKIVAISLLVCFIIGLFMGIYDVLNPLMPEESGAEYTNPNNWNSPVYAKEFWQYALSMTGIWIGLSILVLFVPCFFIVKSIKKNKS